MLCQYCDKNNATIHYTEVINGQVKKIHICENCAKTKGIDAGLPFSFSDVFSALSKGLEKISSLPNAATDASLQCPGCNLQIQELMNQGRMGCAQCYETFESILNDILTNVQKSPCHVGKMPRKCIHFDDVNRRIEEREKNLQAAIREERYEDCVVLRDELRKLKEALDSHRDA